jgi:hypothetical protein
MLLVQQFGTSTRERTKTGKYGMTDTQPGKTARAPVVDARLGRLLGAVFLLFALLAVNSVYLGAITLLEQTGDAIYQDYFYQAHPLSSTPGSHLC